MQHWPSFYREFKSDQRIDSVSSNKIQKITKISKFTRCWPMKLLVAHFCNFPRNSVTWNEVKITKVNEFIRILMILNFIGQTSSKFAHYVTCLKIQNRLPRFKIQNRFPECKNQPITVKYSPVTAKWQGKCSIIDWFLHSDPV